MRGWDGFNLYTPNDSFLFDIYGRLTSPTFIDYLDLFWFINFSFNCLIFLFFNFIRFFRIALFLHNFSIVNSGFSSYDNFSESSFTKLAFLFEFLLSSLCVGNYSLSLSSIIFILMFLLLYKSSLSSSSSSVITSYTITDQLCSEECQSMSK